MAMNELRPTRSPTDPQARWLAIVSGEKRGFGAAAARCFLAHQALLYRCGLAVRNLICRLPGRVKRAPCPVVSVGNLTVGGTGKTPMVAYLARLVTELGKRPLIVSRGYGSRPGRPNEEAQELERLCPGVPHVQNPDRFAAISAWMTGNPCDVAILDDGFQHRRLARDVDIVLVDALRPFGFGHLVPRGLLREPLSALRRADMAIVTRAELVAEAEVSRLKRDLAALARPATPILVARHQPTGLAMFDGSRRPAEWLRGEDVAAACAIGNPEAFRRTIEQLGARVKLFKTFRDHHAYTREDLTHLIELARAAGVKTLVTTGKDSVKWVALLGGEQGAPVEIGAVEVAIRLVEGEAILRDRVAALWPNAPC
ncbi:MAG: tetraacyldisaccharide 4'-kinase [Planctomycetota bacterium]|nr:tetraacyldisaccharide 4'-kinase [Planctomycetota bacterium]